MRESFGIEGVPDRLAEMNLVARDWWLGHSAGLLPGEAGGVTVFVIDFADGCRFFGYTGSRVFDRVSDLATRRGAYKTNAFVSAHAVEVPYVVRCVASGLGRSDARQLRDFLVLLAPSRSAGSGKSVVESECCWLADDEVVGESLPFSEFGSLDLSGSLGSWQKQKLP